RRADARRTHERQRAGAVPRPGADGSAAPGRGGVRGAGAARTRGGSPSRRAPLRPVRDDRRAAPLAAVVRAHEAPGGASTARGTDRTRALHAGAVPQDLRALARERPRLVHLAAALVGTPDPRVVLPRGWVRRDDRGPRGPDVELEVRRFEPRAGSGRARHLVLLLALAVLDPRLAGRDRRPEGVLPDEHAGHCTGDPV